MTERIRTALDRLGHAGYLRKWLLLSSVIGVVAGVGAIVFIHAVELASEALLGGLGGYHPPSPVGEAAGEASSGFVRPWAIPAIVAIGGLLSGILVSRFAPEAEGHGTDAAIDAVHHNPKGIRPRVAMVKLVASAVTIGSGGSGGREGPTAQISSAFGSFLARFLNLTPADARIAVIVGIGAGIGAIFRAPLGGAVIGAEILYLEDLESDALLPSFIGSIVAFSIFGAVEGFTPIFGFLRGYHFIHPVELFYFALLGVVAGLLGRFYSTIFYRTIDLFRALRAPEFLKPAIGGLAVGLMGLMFPAALLTGYGHVQEAMTSEVFDVPVWLLLLLPIVKVVSTSLSIGSGGSAGIFGPGMVIGGLLGAALWRILHDIPGMPVDPAPFVVVGMVACFGSISHAYLAVMLMVAEMTGSLALLPPAMIALGAAALVVGNKTIYTSQIRNRAESVAFLSRLGLPLMVTIPVEQAMTAPRLVVPEEWSRAEVVSSMDELHLPGAPVVSKKGHYAGVALRSAQTSHRPEGGFEIDREYPTIPLSSTLDAALDALAMGSVDWVPVVEDGRVLGIVSTSDLLRAYQGALATSQRRIGTALRDAVLLEAEVQDDATITAGRLRDLPLPPGTVILTVLRSGQLLVPTGDTVLQTGDKLHYIAHGRNDQIVKEMLGKDPEANDRSSHPPGEADLL